MKTVTVNGVAHADGCDRCGKRQAMHQGAEDLCCLCYVLAGNPPADWHPACLDAAETLAAWTEPEADNPQVVS